MDVCHKISSTTKPTRQLCPEEECNKVILTELYLFQSTE